MDKVKLFVKNDIDGEDGSAETVHVGNGNSSADPEDDPIELIEDTV